MSNGPSAPSFSPMTVVGISGSLRQKSFNTMLLKAALSFAPRDMTINTASFVQFPLYNQDVQDAGFPQPVTALAEQVTKADGVLIVSPEYNYSIPGGLKNAIDWLSRVKPQPFDGKLIAIMGASPGRLGTARMQYHLRQSFVFLNGIVLNRPEVMVAGAGSAFDEAGGLKDEATGKLVGDLLQALARAIADQRRLKAAP